jgi:repressor LexA
MNLTAKQYQIIKLIWNYRKLHGIAPTLAELATELDVSKITVHEHISLLEKKKALTKEKYQSRSLRLSKRMERHLETVERERSRQTKVKPQAIRPTSFPLLGRIAAGVPVEALENAEKIDLHDIVRLDKCNYLLRVKGESMVEEGIHHGDYVFVEYCTQANNGDIVVAVVEDNEATLKFYHKRGDRHHLIPANPRFKTIVTSDVEIRGRVVGVIRNYG